jgi:hypothetical protein
MGTRSLNVPPQPTEKPLEGFCPSVRCDHGAQSRKKGVEIISEFTDGTKENLLK